VLAVTLYGVTRDEDHELAMLALVCRVAEACSVRSVSELPGIGVAGEGRSRARCPGRLHNECATYVSADAGAERPPQYDLLCRGEYDLFLSPPAWTDGARLNRMDGRVRIGLLVVALPCKSPVSPQGR